MSTTHSPSISSLDLVNPTIEAVTLNAASGVLAQAFVAYKAKDLFAVDIGQILQFMLFTAITAAPNYIFQMTLEKRFPTRTVPAPILKQARKKDRNSHDDHYLLEKHGQLDVRNTIIKFFLDQSLSATTNTMLFIVVFGLIKGQSLEYISESLRTDFWPMLFAGYRFWPMVCLLNLVMVPLEYRPLVGNGAGLVWGVFMSLW